MSDFRLALKRVELLEKSRPIITLRDLTEQECNQLATSLEHQQCGGVWCAGLRAHAPALIAMAQKWARAKELAMQWSQRTADDYGPGDDEHRSEAAFEAGILSGCGKQILGLDDE